MDKAEYQSRLEELNSLVKKEDYEGALAVVESVDWRRVKSLRTLGMVADVYEANKRYPEAKKILLMAYDRSSIGKGILYRLVEVSVKMKDFDEAIDFYNEFEEVAHHDNSRYLLKYKILKGQKAPLEQQISLLEEYKEREFTERWAYELANLYSKAGETQKCVAACDELILWFSEGKYVTKAMELKMKYEPLSPSQKVKYEHRFDYKKNEEPSEDPEALEVRLAGESGAGEMAATKEPAGMQEVKPVSGGVLSQYLTGEEEKEAGSPYEAYQKTQQAKANAAQVQEYEAEPQTKLIKEVPEEKAYADNTPTYLGNTIDLHAELAKSIRDVFSFRGKKQEETAEEEEPVKEEETSDEPVQYEIKDLEPEQLDVNVEIAPDANMTIKTRPQPKPKEKAEPVMPKTREEKTYEEPDLAALFQETAANLSEEVAEEEAETTEQPMDPEFATKAEEEAAEPTEPAEEAETTEQPINPASEANAEEEVEIPQPEAETEEKEEVEPAETSDMDETVVIPDLKPVEDTRATIDFGELQAALDNEVEAAEQASETEIPAEPSDPFEPADTRPIEITPEEIEIEVPTEPKRESVSDATINMSVERTADATVQLIRDKIPKGTVAKSIEEVLRDETPEETRLRILNDTQPEKLNDEQKALFTYFAKVPGMDIQILDAMHGVYHYAGDRTSRHGNIAIMGGYGTGKTKLSEDLVRAICADLKIPATKMARLDASALNKKDCAQIVSKLSGGFLLIERAGLMYPETIEKLSQAMDFRTDSLVLIIEDEKVSMRGLLRNYPDFAKKFETVISIPVFTNDELVTFARTYARENGYKMDEMGVLALYTQIGNNQKEGEPMTIAKVKEMVDRAIAHAEKGTRKFGRRMSRKHTDADDRVILYEKDFEF
mgnify:CR=1 FL=1